MVKNLPHDFLVVYELEKQRKQRDTLITREVKYRLGSNTHWPSISVLPSCPTVEGDLPLVGTYGSSETVVVVGTYCNSETLTGSVWSSQVRRPMFYYSLGTCWGKPDRSFPCYENQVAKTEENSGKTAIHLCRYVYHAYV